MTRAAVARRAGETPLQKTVADELAEVEAEEKVTGALQALDPHNIKHKHRRTGQKPLEPTAEGVSNTPMRTPKKGQTQSPVRIDKNGDAWEFEDDEAQEEREEQGRACGCLIRRCAVVWRRKVRASCCSLGGGALGGLWRSPNSVEGRAHVASGRCCSAMWVHTAHRRKGICRMLVDEAR